MNKAQIVAGGLGLFKNADLGGMEPRQQMLTSAADLLHPPTPDQYQQIADMPLEWPAPEPIPPKAPGSVNGIPDPSQGSVDTSADNPLLMMSGLAAKMGWYTGCGRKGKIKEKRKGAKAMPGRGFKGAKCGPGCKRAAAQPAAGGGEVLSRLLSLALTKSAGMLKPPVARPIAGPRAGGTAPPMKPAVTDTTGGMPKPAPIAAGAAAHTAIGSTPAPIGTGFGGSPAQPPAAAGPIGMGQQPGAKPPVPPQQQSGMGNFQQPAPMQQQQQAQAPTPKPVPSAVGMVAGGRAQDNRRGRALSGFAPAALSGAAAGGAVSAATQSAPRQGAPASNGLPANEEEANAAGFGLKPGETQEQFTQRMVGGAGAAPAAAGQEASPQAQQPPVQPQGQTGVGQMARPIGPAQQNAAPAAGQAPPAVPPEGFSAPAQGSPQDQQLDADLDKIRNQGMRKPVGGLGDTADSTDNNEMAQMFQYGNPRNNPAAGGEGWSRFTDAAQPPRPDTAPGAAPGPTEQPQTAAQPSQPPPPQQANQLAQAGQALIPGGGAPSQAGPAGGRPTRRPTPHEMAERARALYGDPTKGTNKGWAADQSQMQYTDPRQGLVSANTQNDDWRAGLQDRPVNL